MRSLATVVIVSGYLFGSCTAFTISMSGGPNTAKNNIGFDRRGFLTKTVSVAAAVAITTTTVTGTVLSTQPANAAPQILSTTSGIKYAILKPAEEKRTPLDRDVVAIEYTGYLTDGTIFDSTHAEGKKNALVFQVGSPVVIEGINDLVKYLGVGEKVQAIIPPELAFGDKGICLESGECLVKPKSTLVYDIYLKRSAIPPP